MFKYLIIMFFTICAVFAQNQDNTIELTAIQKAWLVANPKITMVVPKNFPRSYLNKDGKLEGMDIDYFNLIEKKLGIKFDKTILEWHSALKRAMNHEVDLIINAGKLKYREPYLNFSKIYFAIPQAIVTHENEPEISDINDLCGKKIAVHIGSSRAKFLQKNYPCIKLLEVTSKKDILYSVVMNKAYAGFDNFDSLSANIKKMMLPGLKIIYFRYMPPIGFARVGVRKDKPMLTSIVDQAISSISVEEKNKIVSKWLNVKLPPIPKKIEKQKNIKLSSKEKQYLKNKKKIKMCIDPDWMPFEKIENGKHTGLASDYMKIIEKNINIPITLIETKNWNESIQKAKNRECDIFSMVPIIEKRKKYMNFTASYLDIPMVIATKIDKQFIDKIEHILDKKIGIVKSYSISNILKEKYPNINIVDVESINDGLLKVESGKIFAFIDNLATINYMINKNFIGMLKVSGRLDNRLQYRVATRNDEPILNTIFDKIIKNIDAATNEKIFTKWVNTHNKETIVDYTLIWQIIGIFVIIILIGSSFLFISKRNNKKLEELLDTTIEGIAIFQNGKLIKANKPLFAMYGYDSIDEVRGKEAYQFIDETQFEFVQEQLKKEHTIYEVRMKRKDGTLFPVLVKGTNIEADIRVSSVIDITELKDTHSKLEELNRTLESKVKQEVEKNRQQQLLMLHQSRLAQMGEMISMIAHQWRQPLNSLSILSQTIILKYNMNKLDDKMIEYFKINSNRQIQGMSKTIDDFRDFFKPEKEKVEFIINDVIDDTLDMVQPTFLQNQIDVIFDTAKEFETIGYPNELGQAILNIVNNAKDVLIDNDIKNKQIKIELREDENIILTISDNAGGIEEDIIDKIFDPYFSTKQEKNGTGLGLYMTKLIIEDHMGGKLSVSNDIDGARFSIKLETKPKNHHKQ